MTYVVSDLNGHLDVFRDLLKKISFSEKRDVMYVLGDIVDYGPQPMELVQDLSTRINVYPIAGDRDYTAARLLTAYEKMLKTGERPADLRRRWQTGSATAGAPQWRSTASWTMTTARACWII